MKCSLCHNLDHERFLITSTNALKSFTKFHHLDVITFFLLSPVGPCLYESGLVPERLTYLDDVRCPVSFGIGLTNMVERTTRGSADLSR